MLERHWSGLDQGPLEQWTSNIVSSKRSSLLTLNKLRGTDWSSNLLFSFFPGNCVTSHSTPWRKTSWWSRMKDVTAWVMLSCFRPHVLNAVDWQDLCCPAHVRYTAHLVFCCIISLSMRGKSYSISPTQKICFFLCARILHSRSSTDKDYIIFEKWEFIQAVWQHVVFYSDSYFMFYSFVSMSKF